MQGARGGGLRRALPARLRARRWSSNATSCSAKRGSSAVRSAGRDANAADRMSRTTAWLAGPATTATSTRAVRRSRPVASICCRYPAGDHTAPVATSSSRVAKRRYSASTRCSRLSSSAAQSSSLVFAVLPSTSSCGRTAYRRYVSRKAAIAAAAAAPPPPTTTVDQNRSCGALSSAASASFCASSMPCRSPADVAANAAGGRYGGSCRSASAARADSAGCPSSLRRSSGSRAGIAAVAGLGLGLGAGAGAAGEGRSAGGRPRPPPPPLLLLLLLRPGLDRPRCC